MAPEAKVPAAKVPDALVGTGGASGAGPPLAGQVVGRCRCRRGIRAQILTLGVDVGGTKTGASALDGPGPAAIERSDHVTCRAAARKSIISLPQPGIAQFQEEGTIVLCQGVFGAALVVVGIAQEKQRLWVDLV